MIVLMTVLYCIVIALQQWHIAEINKFYKSELREVRDLYKSYEEEDRLFEQLYVLNTIEHMTKEQIDDLRKATHVKFQSFNYDYGKKLK